MISLKSLVVIILNWYLKKLWSQPTIFALFEKGNKKDFSCKKFPVKYLYNANNKISFLIQTDRENKREINENRGSGFRFFEHVRKKVN